MEQHFAGSVRCPLCDAVVSWDVRPRFGSEEPVIRRNLFKHFGEWHPGLRPREQSKLADWVVWVRARATLPVTVVSE